MSSCKVCNKRILSHAHRLTCSVCKSMVHFRCLYGVTVNDSIYTNRNENSWLCPSCIQGILPFNHHNDDEIFIESISTLWDTEKLLPIDIVRAGNDLFIPFDLNENENLPLHDVDPDIQYYNDQCNLTLQSCDYHLENMFNNKLSNLGINSNCWSLFHHNIRSIPNNLSKLENYLSLLEHKFSIIGLSESWLKEHNVDTFSLDGYNSEHNIRKLRNGGGVSLFIRENIEYFVRDDLTYQNENIECLFIEIDKSQNNKDQNSIVGVFLSPT